MKRRSHSSAKSKIVTITILLWLASISTGLLLGLYFSKLEFLEVIVAVFPQNSINPADNILLLGIDNSGNSQRSDVVMLINLDRAQQKIGILSIPRDTKLNIPGFGESKINHAYAWGGAELTKKTISEFLQIPISYYIVVDLEGVKNIIEKVGGVEVTVDKKMYYMDRAGDLFINFDPGEQVLGGEESVSYLRYRSGDNDIARIKRQQNFLYSFAKKVLSPSQIFKLPGLISELNKHINTDLSNGQILNLVLEFKEAIREKRLLVNTLPGSIRLINGVSYWVLDEPQAKAMVNATICGFVEQSLVNTMDIVNTTSLVIALSKDIVTEEVKENIFKDALPVVEKPKSIFKFNFSKFKPNKIEEEISLGGVADRVTVSIEVLNGNGVKGSALKVAKILKEQGLVVPRVENGAHFQYENTVLVDWKGRTNEALAIAKFLKIDQSQIIVYDRSQKTIDMCLVLGADWEKIPGIKEILKEEAIIGLE